LKTLEKNFKTNMPAGNMGLALLGQDVVTSTSATWHLQFGQTEFNLAFCCYLQLQFFNWASVPGGRFSNPPTTPSPVR
jgi:hypothetical protein